MQKILNYVNQRVKQQLSAVEGYLTVTYKIQSHILQGTVHHSLNIIYTINLHEDNCEQSSNTFPG
jgi:hypothetical protein